MSGVVGAVVAGGPTTLHLSPFCHDISESIASIFLPTKCQACKRYDDNMNTCVWIYLCYVWGFLFLSVYSCSQCKDILFYVQ